MKYIITITVSLFLFAGCGSIQNLVDKGMDSAQKSAQNYVDKQAGSGSFDDALAMKNDKQKTSKLLPYYLSVNKMCDENNITAAERDAMKTTLAQQYDSFAAGEIDEKDYDTKCSEIIDSSKNKVNSTE
ncbi:MAG: hypothetical protein K8H86_12140 [Ignavibacteriaceae bacterium]|nr:hypothetical protein [Ignavibacteriaceae bacterium]